MDRGGSFQQQKKTITFVIKTPNLAHGDQTVDGVDMDWTVADLKRHLSAVYPSQPAVSDQRLIYSGKLLPDHLHLRDIFRQTDCSPTLHLVCSARAPAARGPLGARPKVRETEQSASTVQTSMSSSASLDRSPSSPVQSTPTPPPVQSTPTPPPVQSTPTPPPAQSTPTTPELRQRRHAAPAASTPQPDHTQTQTPAWPGIAVPGVAEMAQPAFPTYSLYSPQQLLWLQHVYARQYYMQYHAALAAAGHGTASLAPAATTFGPYPPAPHHHHQAVPVPAGGALAPNQNPIIEPLANPANQNAAGGGAQDGPAFIDPAAANQNLRMNAQGGPVMEDEEDVERDWLDWVYTAARLGVFLSIVYFYSTLSRFVLVMSSLLLMYLHTAGWFPFRRRPLVQGPNQQRAQAQQPPPQAQQNPAPGVEPADGERVGRDAAGEGPEGQGPMTAVLVPPYRVSVVWTAWVFFKSFFSSLIPEAQPGVAN